MTTFNQISHHKKKSPPTWWTPKRLQYLVELWDQGVTGGKIAAELGTTRNAVMGRLRRLGKLRQGEERMPVEAVPIPPPPPLPPPPDPDAPCSIYQLTNETCRWPRDDGLFCGVQQADLNGRRPYCEKHTQVARQSRHT